tara:strand:- start:837 stop:1283 length:447 start_codon:yes stop_codon:yes gene_type:complete
MALTVTRTGDWSGIEGNKRTGLIKIDFDSSYPTGGEALSASEFGLSKIEELNFMSQGRLGYVFYTDTALPATTVNIEVLCPTGGTAPTAVGAPTQAASAVMAASGADSTSLVDHTHVAGATTGGRGVEMGNTADLSTLTAIWIKATGI